MLARGYPRVAPSRQGWNHAPAVPPVLPPEVDELPPVEEPAPVLAPDVDNPPLLVPPLLVPPLLVPPLDEPSVLDPLLASLPLPPESPLPPEPLWVPLSLPDASSCVVATLAAVVPEVEPPDDDGPWEAETDDTVVKPASFDAALSLPVSLSVAAVVLPSAVSSAHADNNNQNVTIARGNDAVALILAIYSCSPWKLKLDRTEVAAQGGP